MSSSKGEVKFGCGGKTRHYAKTRTGSGAGPQEEEEERSEKEKGEREAPSSSKKERGEGKDRCEEKEKTTRRRERKGAFNGSIVSQFLRDEEKILLISRWLSLLSKFLSGILLSTLLLISDAQYEEI